MKRRPPVQTIGLGFGCVPSIADATALVSPAQQVNSSKEGRFAYSISPYLRKMDKIT